MNNQPMPLTDFLIAMLKVDPAKLAKADVTRLAAKYGVDADHARGYIGLHCRSG